MRTARPNLLPTLLCGLLLAVTSAAQETVQVETLAVPQLASLPQNAWDYFDGAPDEIEPRIAIFLEQVNQQISGLSAQNQEIAPAIVEALSDNLEVYLSLLKGVEIERERLPEPAATYSIDGLLEIAATSRSARDAAEAAQAEVEREQRILAGASRRRDALFNDYLDAAEGDDRWLTGLRLVSARSAQAIAERRLDVLTESAAFATQYANDTAARVDLVRERVATEADEEALAQLVEAGRSRSEAVSAAEERAREAPIAASGLDVDTAEDRSEQRLL